MTASSSRTKISTVLDEEERIQQSHRPSSASSSPQSFFNSNSTPSPNRTLALTYASAGLGNAISAICSNPQDLIKVRQQLLLGKDGGKSDFLSIGKEMIRKEGVRSLWNGVTASCIRELTYSTIRIGSYESFKDFYSTSLGVSEQSFALKVLSGLTSGAIGSALTSPVDLVKVRFQAVRPNGLPPYKNSFVAFAHVYREGSTSLNPQGQPKGFIGGFKSLYRGVGPTIIRASLLTSSQIATYDYTKNYIKSKGRINEGLPLHFYSSMIAGFFASVSSAPFDTVKIRLMQDKKREFKNAMDCAGKLVRNEGPLALYKGFAMCWARLGSHTVISLILFEQLRSLFGIKPL